MGVIQVKESQPSNLLLPERAAASGKKILREKMVRKEVERGISERKQTNKQKRWWGFCFFKIYRKIVLGSPYWWAGVYYCSR